MINISFKITHIPEFSQKINTDIQLLYDFEGDVSIFDGENLLFDGPGFSLLDLAVGVSVWLNKIQNEDSVFNLEFFSVDIEEGPMLGYIQESNDQWRVESAWGKNIFKNKTLEELVKASSSFIDRFKAACKDLGYNFDHWFDYDFQRKMGLGS